jgi:hypothetical protein
MSFELLQFYCVDMNCLTKLVKRVRGNKSPSATTSSRREMEVEHSPKLQRHRRHQPEPKLKAEADLDPKPLKVEPLHVDTPYEEDNDENMQQEVYEDEDMQKV